MSLKSFGHSLEKAVFRPIFRGLRKLLGITPSSTRIAALEDRIERLEGLFREQAGLHYLRLAGTPDDEAAPDDTPRRDTA
ncbi:MAG: hypothetical protein ACKO4T_02685 [Planctomycetaceae bacterium]